MNRELTRYHHLVLFLETSRVLESGKNHPQAQTSYTVGCQRKRIKNRS